MSMMPQPESEYSLSKLIEVTFENECDAVCFELIKEKKPDGNPGLRCNVEPLKFGLAYEMRRLMASTSHEIAAGITAEECRITMIVNRNDIEDYKPLWKEMEGIMLLGQLCQ